MIDTFAKMPEGEKDDERVYIVIHWEGADIGTGLYQYYEYKWVDDTVSAAAVTSEADSSSAESSSADENSSSEDESSLWIVQDVSKNALESAGEDEGTEIIPGIITGKKDDDDDDRSSSAAEKALAAAGGAGIAITAGLASANNESNKKKKISYKMLISKDFGDTVDVHEHYIVYARIVQIHSGADLTRNADEYTRMIKVSSPNRNIFKYFRQTFKLSFALLNQFLTFSYDIRNKILDCD